jgi:hypothetical protein
VEVVDALSSVRALVDDEPIAVRQTQPLGDGLRGVQDVSVVTVVREIGEPRDLLAGDDEHVDGGLRVNVAKGDDVLVLVNDVGRDLPLNDPCEQSGHDKLWRVRPEAVLVRVKRNRALTWLSWVIGFRMFLMFVPFQRTVRPPLWPVRNAAY